MFYKFIADSPDRLDIYWMIRIGFNFSSDMTNMGCYIGIVMDIFFIPDNLINLLMCKYKVWITC